MPNTSITDSGCTCCEKVCAGADLVEKSVDSSCYDGNTPTSAPDPAGLDPYQSATFTGGYVDYTTYLGCINWGDYTETGVIENTGIVTANASTTVLRDDGFGGCDFISSTIPWARRELEETASYTINTTTDLLAGTCSFNPSGTRTTRNTLFLRPYNNGDVATCSNNFELYGDKSRETITTESLVDFFGTPRWEGTFTTTVFNYTETTDPVTGHISRTLDSTTVSNGVSVTPFGYSHWSPTGLPDFTDVGSMSFTGTVGSYDITSSGRTDFNLTIAGGEPEIPDLIIATYDEVDLTETWDNPYYGVWCISAAPQPFFVVKWRGIATDIAGGGEVDWGAGVVTISDLTDDTNAPASFESTPFIGVPTSLACHNSVETIYFCEQGTKNLVVNRE